MNQSPDPNQWILVRADALPEVYRKVLEVQQRLASGQYASVSEATRESGLSRSAFYKYKDAVAPHFGEDIKAEYMTVELVLQDCPGVLSNLLSAFAAAGTNIVTVNQTSPADGKAHISICAKVDGTSFSMSRFATELSNIPGVQRIRSIRHSATEEQKGKGNKT